MGDNVPKIDIILSTIEDIGCDLDDALEKGLAFEKVLGGGHAMIVKLARELPDILELEDEALLKFNQFMEGKRREEEKKLDMARGYSKGLQDSVKMIDEKRKSNIVKSNSQNVGTHPDSRKEADSASFEKNTK